VTVDTPAKLSRRAKRGNGEGSVYYDERLKIWRATVQIGGGKRRYLSGKTRQDVAQKLVAAAREIQQGQLPPNQRLTLGHFLDQWLEQSAKPRLKASTFESYRHYLDKHIKPALGTRPVAKLTAQEVQAFLNQKATSGLRPRTVQYLHGIVRAALNRAVKWQVIPRNVALLVDPPRGGRPAIRPLAPEAAATFLAAAYGHCYEHLYAFLLASGLRLGEALALRWRDVDLERRRFRVEHTLENLRGRPWRLTEPKSVSGRAPRPSHRPCRGLPPCSTRPHRRTTPRRRPRLARPGFRLPQRRRHSPRRQQRLPPIQKAPRSRESPLNPPPPRPPPQHRHLLLAA
jgi:integrase